MTMSGKQQQNKHQNKETDQWNQIESPQTDPTIYGHSAYDRVDNIQIEGERTGFQKINDTGKSQSLHRK